jgi:hypothetical protein
MVMSSSPEMRSPFLELEVSKNYIDMEDADLFDRHLYWKEYQKMPGLTPHLQAMAQIIVRRQSLEITERQREEAELEAIFELPASAA